MATEYSFDVVSRVDITEVKNAIDQTEREISSRFDFRGSVSSIELSENELKIHSDDEFKLELLLEILRTRLAKRNVSLKSLEYGKVESATRSSVRQTVTLKQGIPTDEAKRIVREIKSSGLKVNAQIQGDQVRISSKDKDSLQNAQKFIRELPDLVCDVDFDNYR